MEPKGTLFPYMADPKGTLEPTKGTVPFRKGLARTLMCGSVLISVVFRLSVITVVKYSLLYVFLVHMCVCSCLWVGGCWQECVSLVPTCRWVLGRLC